MKFCPFNFGGIENQNFERAKIVILPVPFEETTDFFKGTISGPEAIISASRDLDEVDKNLPVFTFDEIELEGEGIKEKMKELGNFVSQILKKKKIPILIGGEHTITFGSILGVREKYSDFSILQLDAHCDSLNEYKKSKLNYATVMRRVRELGIEVVPVGIRSIDKETEIYLEKEKIEIFKAPEIPVKPVEQLRLPRGGRDNFAEGESGLPYGVKEILKRLKKRVYLTIDLDVLDPSIMPAVSNPAPGGLQWADVLNLIENLAKNKKIIGVDVVEFCPIASFLCPDFLAAKLIYKIIEYLI
jgi:agmatinase